MSQDLTIDDLSFELRRSEKRKTVGITIERNGTLVLAAPADCPLERIEQIAKEKRFWIYTKLAEKEMLFKPQRSKEYVTGEGFYYLGRSYRLSLINPSTTQKDIQPLRLHQGRFMLRRDEHRRARGHFVKWYIEHASSWIPRKVSLFANRLDVDPPEVEIRDLGFRWGSCSHHGIINLHWRTILLPPRIIEYIVAHEMVHLHVPLHSGEFWKRLQRAMPDYAERKQWLAENGSYY
jgi:predicted metal-dependent hydrolase